MGMIQCKNIGFRIRNKAGITFCMTSYLGIKAITLGAPPKKDSKTCLQAMFLLEFQVFSVKCVNTINHTLDKFDFGVAQTMFVGNVISNAGLTARFTAGSTGLKFQFFAPGLQGWKTFFSPSC